MKKTLSGKFKTLGELYDFAVAAKDEAQDDSPLEKDEWRNCPVVSGDSVPSFAVLLPINGVMPSHPADRIDPTKPHPFVAGLGNKRFTCVVCGIASSRGGIHNA